MEAPRLGHRGFIRARPEELYAAFLDPIYIERQVCRPADRVP